MAQWYIDVKANLTLFYGHPPIQHLRTYIYLFDDLCVCVVGVQVGDGSPLTTLLLLNSLHAPCGAGH